MKTNKKVTFVQGTAPPEEDSLWMGKATRVKSLLALYGTAEISLPTKQSRFVSPPRDSLKERLEHGLRVVKQARVEAMTDDSKKSKKGNKMAKRMKKLKHFFSGSKTDDAENGAKSTPTHDETPMVDEPHAIQHAADTESLLASIDSVRWYLEHLERMMANIAENLRACNVAERERDMIADEFGVSKAAYNTHCEIIRDRRKLKEQEMEFHKQRATITERIFFLLCNQLHEATTSNA